MTKNIYKQFDEWYVKECDETDRGQCVNCPAYNNCPVKPFNNKALSVYAFLVIGIILLILWVSFARGQNAKSLPVADSTNFTYYTYGYFSVNDTIYLVVGEDQIPYWIIPHQQATQAVRSKKND